MPRRLLLLIALLGIGVAIEWWSRSRRDAASATAIRGSGIIEITEVDVAFEVPGTITERFIDEGAVVDRARSKQARAPRSCKMCSEGIGDHPIRPC